MYKNMEEIRENIRASLKNNENYMRHISEPLVAKASWDSYVNMSNKLEDEEVEKWVKNKWEVVDDRGVEK